MKKAAMVILAVALLMGCATPASIEQKRGAGNSRVEVFEAGFDQTYEAFRLVCQTSFDRYIQMRYHGGITDFAKEGRRIIVSTNGLAQSVDTVIFFEPAGNMTKVEIVKGSFTGAAWRQNFINSLVDETRYLITNGIDDYRRYTTERRRQFEDSKNS